MDIIFFDCESTGTNCCQDRIVQIAAQKLNSDWQATEPLKKYLINPGIPIPEAATAIHGITNEMVTGAPTFGQLAKGMFEWMKDCILAGYNVVNFDIPLLSEEFSRVNMNFPAPGVKVLDACKIFFQKEPRDLANAMRFYCGRDLLGAHDAGNDVDASIEVLTAQLNHYPDLQELSVEELSTYCIGPNSVDLAGKFERNADGKVVFTFGKHKGEVINARHRKDHEGFLNWMLRPEQSFPADTRRIARSFLIS